MVKASRVIDQAPENDDVPEVDPEARKAQLARQAQAMLPTLTTRKLSTEDLHAITSFDDAVRVYGQITGQDFVEAREEIGDGFDYLENKDMLVGRPCALIQWELGLSPSFTNEQGMPLPTVQVWILAQGKSGEAVKVRISDFSTGLCAQLWEYTKRTGRSGGIHAPKGLRKSEFSYTAPDGAQSMAKTYYLDLSRDL